VIASAAARQSALASAGWGNEPLSIQYPVYIVFSGAPYWEDQVDVREDFWTSTSNNASQDRRPGGGGGAR
jgi:hypothetical protein